MSADLIKKVFAEMDKDGGGTVSVAEAEEYFKNNRNPFGKEFNFKEADKSGDGELDFAEFSAYITSTLLRKIFAEMDKDGDGTITVDEADEYFKKNENPFGKAFSFKDADASGDGAIDFDEFSAYITKLA